MGQKCSTAIFSCWFGESKLLKKIIPPFAGQKLQFCFYHPTWRKYAQVKLDHFVKYVINQSLKPSSSFFWEQIITFHQLEFFEAGLLDPIDHSLRELKVTGDVAMKWTPREFNYAHLLERVNLGWVITPHAVLISGGVVPFVSKPPNFLRYLQA